METFYIVMDRGYTYDFLHDDPWAWGIQWGPKDEATTFPRGIAHNHADAIPGAEVYVEKTFEDGSVGGALIERGEQLP